MKRPRNTKTGKKVDHPKNDNSHQFPRSKFEGQGHHANTMLRPEVRHIFRKKKPTNFKLGTGTEHDDPHQQQAP